MWKKIRWILLAVMVVITIIIGYYLYSLWHFERATQVDPKDSPFVQFEDQKEPPRWEGTERVNILMLGGDSRGLKENEIPRSDSLMLVSLDPIGKKVSMFSILRDTYVSIPGHGKERINTAIVMGGPNLAMETVSYLLGIPVQYYIYTDFKGFIALIDSIGGLDFEVEKDMKYSDASVPMYDIDLKKGLQHLTGNAALQYVKFRHDAKSDFTRTERQRNFMKALAVELQTTSSLLQLPRILNSIIGPEEHPYIETNLSLNDMLKLSNLAFSSSTDGLVSEQLPPLTLMKEQRIDVFAVITADKDKLQSFVQSKFADALAETPVTPGPTMLNSQEQN